MKPIVYDRKEALVQVYDDEGILVQLEESFLGDCPALLAAIREATRNGGDGKTLADAAHKLKGSLGCFRAWRAFYAAERLERVGCEKSFAQTAEALESLERELEAFRAAIFSERLALRV